MPTTATDDAPQLRLVHAGRANAAAAASAGSDDRFAQLVRCHHHALYRSALRQLRCEQDALDCAQEALIAAWRAGAAERDPRSSSRAWLLRITQRKVIDCARRRRREHAIGGEEAEVEQVAAPADLCTQVADRAQTFDALGALRDEFRGVALLRLVYDLSEAETARRLGLPLNTVKTRLHRARRDLAARLCAA